MSTTLPTPTVSPIAPSVGRDRFGLTYAELLAVQQRHLTWWGHLLHPKHHKALVQYCERTNRPMEAGRPAHTVPRGVDLANWLTRRAQFELDDEQGTTEWLRDQVLPQQLEFPESTP